jgi:long-chain acyl-CoA synthetase
MWRFRQGAQRQPTGNSAEQNLDRSFLHAASRRRLNDRLDFRSATFFNYSLRENTKRQVDLAEPPFTGGYDMAGVRDAQAASLDTFPKLMLHHARVRPSRPSMRWKDLGIWQTWTWAEVNAEVRAFSVGLQRLGLKRGQRVAVVGSNRPRLYWAMLSAQALGAVPVPVYADAVADEMGFVLENAEVSMAVVEDQEQVDKVLSVAERVPGLTMIIHDDERGLRDYDRAMLRSFAVVRDDGQMALDADRSVEAEWQKSVEAGAGSDTSIILYTSGTTGRSKGVVLSSARSIAAASDTVRFDKLTDADEVVSYLPLAWVGDHYLSFAQGLVAGFCISCPESAATVQQDTREIGPTFYFAPPRVLENLLTRVMIRMEDASGPKKRVFHHFLAVAKQWGEKILNGESVPLSARAHYALGEILIYGPLKNVLGFSKIRVAYTAGEAIGPDLFAFYRSLGINLKQLYGQTEAFLYVTCQPDGEIDVETVGPAAPNVEIRIEPNGEVLFRSPGQFVTYLNDSEKTAETMTSDGFVKTGDAGFFDRKGHLKIIDRAKDVGKLTDGSLFAPKYIENKLKFFPNVKEAVAFGDGQDFVACFINIDLTAVGNWAERNNIVYSSYQELAGNPLVYAMIEKNVEIVNRSLAAEEAMAGAQIKRFLILHKELDADDGELTRTQKVRRSFIAERYGVLIDAFYSGKSECPITTEVTFEDGRKGVVSANVKIKDMAIHTPAALKVAAE